MTERKDLFAGLVKMVVELGFYTEDQIMTMEWVGGKPVELVNRLQKEHPDAIIDILGAATMNRGLPEEAEEIPTVFEDSDFEVPDASDTVSPKTRGAVPLEAVAEREDVLKEVLEELIVLEEAAKQTAETPIMRLVDSILMDAIRCDASEIHFGQFAQDVDISFCLDGAMHVIMRPPLRLRDTIVARLKVMAKLDIAKTQEVQAAKFVMSGGELDREFILVIIPTVPTSDGERAILFIQSE